MEKLKRVNWTFSGFLLTAVALGITTYGLVSNTTQLGHVATNVSTVSSILDKRLPIIDKTWALSNLSSEGYLTYTETNQEYAALHDPAYVEPDVTKGWILTSKGKQVLLNTGLWDEARQIMEEKPELPLNEVILELGVDSLYDKAEEQEIALDIMIATCATYIQERQREQ